jgi:hypothetical protein
MNSTPSGKGALAVPEYEYIREAMLYKKGWPPMTMNDGDLLILGGLSDQYHITPLYFFSPSLLVGYID